MFAATATKSRLRHVNLFHIYLDPESYTDMSAESAENRHLLFVTWAREDTRNSIFCNR